MAGLAGLLSTKTALVESLEARAATGPEGLWPRPDGCPGLIVRLAGLLPDYRKHVNILDFQCPRLGCRPGLLTVGLAGLLTTQTGFALVTPGLPTVPEKPWPRQCCRPSFYIAKLACLLTTEAAFA